MKKINLIKLNIGIVALCTSMAFGDATGFYLGGGLGYGMQSLTSEGNSGTTGTPSIRIFGGYQLANWIDAEAGYTYISQAENWNNLGNPSSTIYDISFTPGYTLPATPVTIFARVGIDGVSANLNSSWYNQVISNMQANFEYGAGVKVDIPGTSTFVRAEYINFGGATNNSNSTVSTTPSVVMITAAYIF